MEMSFIVDLVSKIEGPYKWYVLGGVIVVLTALVTRFIFKTLKWFFLIVAAAIIIFTIVNYFVDLDIPLAIEDTENKTILTK